MSAEDRIPCHVKLAGVKRGIYNPHLPSLKRIEMEDCLGKLPGEHQRTVLPCGLDAIPEELFYQYYPPQNYVKGFDMLPLYHKEWKEDAEVRELSFLQNRHLACKWEEFKKGLPVAEKRIINIPALRDFHFMNYYVRYMKPDVTASYRLKLKPGPKLLGEVQFPIPADKHLQYRDCY